MGDTENVLKASRNVLKNIQVSPRDIKTATTIK